MTREEAIGILNETQVVYFAPNGKKKVQEALDMAIEALKADVARWSSWNKTFEQSGIADLISRADAIDAVKHSTAYMHDDLYEAISRIPSAETTGALDDAIAKYVADGLMKLPSADRQKGEWMFRTIEIVRGGTSMGYVCSNCGKDYWQVDGMNYCPNCGADMRGNK